MRRKKDIEQLLQMSKRREFQIAGTATEKLLEPKHIRTQGTDNRLVPDELFTTTFRENTAKTGVMQSGMQPQICCRTTLQKHFKYTAL